MNERAVMILAWLCVLGFGVLWLGAWRVLGFPLWVTIPGALVSGWLTLYVAENR